MSLELYLNMEVARGNMKGVNESLEAGACIDGSSDLPTRPLVIAAEMGRVEILEMLVGRGADLEVTVTCQHIVDGIAVIPIGSRAVHAAVIGTKVGAVRCLLKAGANPDVVNSAGFTPLMLAYNSPEIVAELLKGGADPAFANGDGTIALHVHALNGAYKRAMKLLVEAAPSTLNQLSNPGYTPLNYAAEAGVETSVAFLLAAGAKDRDVAVYGGISSLWKAVENGHERVVRMLAGAGMTALGGSSMAVLGAMCRASQQRMPRILDALLGVEGERRKKHWAREIAGNIPILHHACMYGSLPTVAVCLAAGADEKFVNSTGMRAGDIAGIYAPPNKKNQDRLGAAIRRKLDRGPAFRARSWAWALKARAASGKLASAGVRVFRPRNDRFFSTRFARYSRK